MRKQLVFSVMLSLGVVGGMSFCPVEAHASMQQDQTIKVSGQVVDQDGEALIGATVKVVGASKGTVTDMDGNYSVKADSKDVLVFSFDNDNNNNLHVTDTVWIKKEDYPHFESVDCSAAFFHIITDVRYTRNYIDSIVIKNPSVTYDSKTVHFYFYPKSSN